MVNKTLDAFLKVIRFDKPIGSLLLLWPTLWALWIANQGVPPWSLLLIFVSGVVVMRSAGCIINDIADRDIDGHVQRTQHRPLVSGALSVQRASLYLFILLCTAFLLVCMTNTFTVKLAFVGAGLAMLYPFCKRFFAVPQMVLGLAFAWAVPMAFAASTNQLPPFTWLLFLAAVLWPIAYDTMYAMADRNDDLKIGIHSSAIWLGQHDRVVIAVLQIAVLAILALVGYLLQLNLFYYIGLSLAAAFAVYQQFLIRQRDPQHCFQAFLNNHWFGFAITLGLMTSYYFSP